MNPADRDIIVGIAGFAIAIPLAPILALALKRSRLFAASSWTAPIALAVAASWALQIIFRIAIELPLNMERAKAKGDLMYDGVGGNVAILMAGWLEPLILCLALVGVVHLLNKKRNEN
jgi:hypothetical protein